MKLSSFDYTYPKELIAQKPPADRDQSRMMIVDRKNESWIHSTVLNLPDFLSVGDVIVLNDTKVIPARLLGKRNTGGSVSVLLIEKLSNPKLWKAILTRANRIKTGDEIFFSNNFSAKIFEHNKDSVVLEFNKNDIQSDLEKLGLTPLPPYIRASKEPTLQDKERYQTIYAKNLGSSAAPTAGLHFTKKLLDEIERRGVKIVHITLHVGLDTFSPVRVDDIKDHRMHGERIVISDETANIINTAKSSGNKILAVGTTTVRAVESASKNGDCESIDMTTDLFIKPGYKFKIVDAMLTNFHQPRSTLLMMVSAFAGRDLILKCYAEAISQKYRLFSYGDCMLIV